MYNTYKGQIAEGIRDKLTLIQHYRENKKAPLEKWKYSRREETLLFHSQPQNAKKLKQLSVFIQTNSGEFNYCNPISNKNKEATNILSLVTYLELTERQANW